MKKNAFVFLTILGLSLFLVSHQRAGQVLGESSSSLTFPIAELGSCASIEECKTYCNKTENREACMTFSKSRGLTKKVKPSGIVSGDKQKLLELAKQTLGCTDETTCKELCSQEVNREKCAEIAKKAGIMPQMKQNMQNIETSGLLPDCTKSENKEKCLAFASVCTSYCSRNPDLCKTGENSNRPNISGAPNGGSFTPGLSLKTLQEKTGCKTPEECSTYCKEHQDTCKSLLQSLPKIPIKPSISPEVFVTPSVTEPIQ